MLYFKILKNYFLNMFKKEKDVDDIIKENEIILVNLNKNEVNLNSLMSKTENIINNVKFDILNCELKSKENLNDLELRKIFLIKKEKENLLNDLSSNLERYKEDLISVKKNIKDLEKKLEKAKERNISNEILRTTLEGKKAKESEEFKEVLTETEVNNIVLRRKLNSEIIQEEAPDYEFDEWKKSIKEKV